MTSNQLSNLLLEWTTAIIEINIPQIKNLLLKEPEILWTPIPHTLDEFVDLQAKLSQDRLGSTFQPVSAIQFICLSFHAFEKNNTECFQLLKYLIQQSSLHDLDTRYWGEYNNSTLHLVCFLEDSVIARLLIEKGVFVNCSNDLGYSPRDIIASPSFLAEFQKIPNSMGRAKSVRPNYSTPNRFKLLKELAEESTVASDVNKTHGLKSEGRYFRKGLVKENQKKVLVDDAQTKDSKRQLEVDQLAKKSAVKNNPLFQHFEKQNLIVVPKNIKKLDTAHIESLELPKPQPKPTLSIQTDPTLPDLQHTKSQSSPVESSEQKDPLLTVQIQDRPSDENESAQQVHKARMRNSILMVPQQPILNDKRKSRTRNPVSSATEEKRKSRTRNSFSPTEENRKSKIRDSIVIVPQPDEAKIRNSIMIMPEPELSRIRNSAMISPDLPETSSSSDDDHLTILEETEDESEEENTTPVQIATRLASPVYHSVKVLNDQPAKKPSSPPPTRPRRSELRASVLPPKIDSAHPPIEMKRRSGSQKAAWTMSMSSWAAILDREFSLSELDQENKLKDLQRQAQEEKSELEKKQRQEKKKSIRDDGGKLELTQEEMDHYGFAFDQISASYRQEDTREAKPIKFIEKLETTSAGFLDLSLDAPKDLDYPVGKRSMDSYDSSDSKSFQSSLDKKSLYHEIDALASSLKFDDFETPIIPEPQHFKPAHTTSFGLSRSSSLASHRSRVPQLEEIPKVTSPKAIVRKPVASSLSDPNFQDLVQKSPPPERPTPSHQPNRSTTLPLPNKLAPPSGYGKLYLHVNGIQDILLPMPKDRAYVRCVVSDGRFEYMSRYEILDQNMGFNYECVIDTHPDMIITLSLHVRPDFIMKSRTPFARLFSSKKKKESLSGYVNKEDGAIGQARFALAHMIPACTDVPYPAGFHCFNAWYSKSFKERHRQRKMVGLEQDVLKVVGNFDVEMLFLPTTGVHQNFPRSLKEYNDLTKQSQHSFEESYEDYS